MLHSWDDRGCFKGAQKDRKERTWENFSPQLKGCSGRAGSDRKVITWSMEKQEGHLSMRVGLSFLPSVPLRAPHSSLTWQYHHLVEAFCKTRTTCSRKIKIATRPQKHNFWEKKNKKTEMRPASVDDSYDLMWSFGPALGAEPEVQSVFKEKIDWG